MAASFFKTNPFQLEELLKLSDKGKLQLPDFQRSWVWDEDRIRSLIASVSRAFPVGALMTLDIGGEADFKPRPIEGAPAEAQQASPESLLLDGQQRMTSLYQVSMRGQVVETLTPKRKKVKRWFYIDILKSLDEHTDREEAILSLPEDRRIRSNFGKDIDLDLSSQEMEFERLMFPVSMMFRWEVWQKDFISHAISQGDFEEKWALINRFKDEIIENFTQYQIPVIALDKSTSKEAVCVVFEKVNTGGKPLDAFELVTAMYAADGYELRKDWYGNDHHVGRHSRLANAYKAPSAETGILANVANTDILHVVSLFHTRDRRREAEASGKIGKDLPQVTGNRQALLNLPLTAYKKYQDLVEEGFMRAAQFLFRLHIYRTLDLPYQTQIIPLAAILTALGDNWDYDDYQRKLEQWYWNGVFGELYGSSTETRIARDFIEVPSWLNGGPSPATVSETVFRADRLKTMRMRLSAAYKGVNALLMLEGARDFRSGKQFDHAVFFGENTDIHHIFPQQWCKNKHIDAQVYDSIINKTPLGYKTNRMIGGSAPSGYLHRLEMGGDDIPPIGRDSLNSYLKSHLINPDYARADDFLGFMEDRQRRLVTIIEHAMGKSVYQGPVSEDDDLGELDIDAEESEMTISVK
jgi:hypothetical protein